VLHAERVEQRARGAKAHNRSALAGRRAIMADDKVHAAIETGKKRDAKEKELDKKKKFIRRVKCAIWNS
jgi:hypothetical protein